MKNIALVASYTIDHVLDVDRSLTFDRPGGPALFCKAAFKNMGINVDLITSALPADVNIAIQKGIEEVCVNRIDKINVQNSILSDEILISPILDEINLEDFANKKYRLFLDAQGYMRSKGESGLRTWKCNLEDLNNVSVLKINQKELEYTPTNIMNLFKSRILIITRGHNNVEIWNNGRKFMSKVNKLNIMDTVGAGDYFFATFVASYLNHSNVESAAKQAAETTEAFLLNRSTI